MRNALMVGAAFVGLLAACAGPAYHEKPFYFVDAREQHPTGRIVQYDRPTTCEDTSQPAIIDFDIARRPVWACLTACKPNEEPITYGMALPDSNQATQLDARCEAVCPPETHRRAYIELDRNGQQHCEPGAPPTNQATAMAAEQARIRRVHDAMEGQDFMAAEDQIKSLAKITTWDDAALTSYRLADNAIDSFDRQWSEKTSTEKLRSELRSYEASYRKAASDAKSRHRKNDSYERAHQNCEYTHDSCRATCIKISEHACDRCDEDDRVCEAKAK